MEKVILEGKLTRVDEPNCNNEILPRKVLEEALNNEEFKERLYWNAVFGTIRKPGEEYTETNFENAAFVLKEYDNDLNAKFEILDTPKGKELFNMLKEGKRFSYGYSGGGLYHTEENGTTVMDVLNIQSIDIIDIKD